MDGDEYDWLDDFVKHSYGYVFSCIGVAFIAAAYEVIKFLRSGVEKKVNEQNLCGCDSETAALHGVIAPAGMPCGTTSENRRTELPAFGSGKVGMAVPLDQEKWAWLAEWCPQRTGKNGPGLEMILAIA
ncbi:hypothetical protein ANCDUO_17634 [Ancylostoma duodenale]|uniref:Copper transport protein n=1 Tax=Ancylostoma duodenale TaxID=51022 RepID=A0A0C2G017_9BILA|nr:hypothetical protein ANCDUO_17634 [Ancylostoma duodenale]